MTVFNLVCCQSGDSITGTTAQPDDPANADPSKPPADADSILPYIRTSDFIWGINGHPLRAGAYTGEAEPEAQFDYLDQLRVTYYRIDVRWDTVRNDLVPGGVPFSTVLDVADRHHIYILPLLNNLPDLALPTGPQSVAANAGAGYRIGYAFAAKYGGRVAYIEAGNELDVLARIPGTDGSTISQYDPVKLAFTTAFLRGMTRGIRAAAPHVKIIIDATWRHYPFFDALDRDSVVYDIVGCHWYSDMGDINAPINGGMSALQHFAAFNKDIWITEIDRKNGSELESPSDHQADWIERFSREYYGFDQVKAFLVYELYDERPFIDGTEGLYGLITCPTGAVACGGVTSLKPAFDAYRYAIEEQTAGYQDYVYWLFARLMRRPPDSTELRTWTDRFLALGRESRSKKPAFITSFLPESDSLFIADTYQQLLGRAPADSEIAGWISQLSSGVSRRNLLVSLCNSWEFWTLSGQTDDDFVNRLYQTLLRRNPTSVELTSGLARLGVAASRRDLIDAILDGTEFHIRFVDAEYQALLGRPPSAAERTSYVSAMEAGFTEEKVIATLLNSGEFWHNAIAAGYQRRAGDSRKVPSTGQRSTKSVF